MLILKIIQDDAEEYSGWCWSLCRLILKFILLIPKLCRIIRTTVVVKFTHGDTQVYAEQFWSLHSVVVKFVEWDKVYKTDTEVYTVIMKFTQGDAEICTGWCWFIHPDAEVYTGWYWSIYRLILKLMRCYTEFYTGWW